jgi:hypothetical protein
MSYDSVSNVADEDSGPVKGEEAKKIIQEARDFYRKSLEQDAWNRAQGLDDLKFIENIDNYQWQQDAKDVREGRPILVENRLPQFGRRVINNIRRNRPAISVIPASEDATRRSPRSWRA